MSQVQIHMILNHFPLAGVIFGILLLVFATIRQNETIKNLAYFTFIVSVLFTIPVYVTGEGAEHTVEHMSHVNHDILEAHEDAAKITLVGVIVLALISTLALTVTKHKIAKFLPFIAIVVGIAIFGSMAYTTHLGGRISHPELREGFIAPEHH